MEYAIYFTDDKGTYRLPVNPEELEVSTSLDTETFEVLKLGQIVVPKHLQLKKYGFECELPTKRNPMVSEVFKDTPGAMGLKNYEVSGIPHYVETSNGFNDADFYLGKFESWMKRKLPVQFIASNGISNDITDDVLITELVVIEKAGEEGDKYVQLSMTEYKPYKKMIIPPKVDPNTGKTPKAAAIPTANPKSTGYHTVAKGETLWGIAKKYYGDGSKCNIIYNANKDKVKNPNLIYVGQKLKIPRTEEFNKYSAKLPTTKTTTATKSKATKLATQRTVVGERPVAGISMLLDSIGG